jgi:hypothetical protein
VPARTIRFLCAAVAAISLLNATPVLVAATDGSSNSVTVSVDGTGALTDPTSGIINLTGLSAGTTYKLIDVLQALPPDGLKRLRIYQGTYSMSWSSCGSGTATDGTYNVGASRVTNDFKGGAAPLTAGTLPTITAGAGGVFTCHYTLTFTLGPVTGTATAVREDVVALKGLLPVAWTVSASVGPPHLTPVPGVPEAPIMVLLPLSALAIFSLVVLWEWRRHIGPGY